MKISPKEAEHVARLARLDLSSKERKQYAKELSAVLEYMGKLNKIDTEDITPTYQVTGLADVMREDEVKSTADPEQILKNAPEQEEGQIKVPGVFK